MRVWRFSPGYLAIRPYPGYTGMVLLLAVAGRGLPDLSFWVLAPFFHVSGRCHLIIDHAAPAKRT
ncbi:hypothetical protein CSC3H3_18480 [Thalassospira marina]|uniref:Metal-dependent hydrolase n=1 Tax=Thalassospira marina TaxID=2048283 RepID=A0ABM6QD14_9PROT|nr:hypothetical protein CSC3H3_18480 [Thalassospira marina]